MSKRNKGLIIAVIVIGVIVLCFNTIVTFFTDILWFNELGYISVFLKKILTQLKLGIPVFAVIMLLTFLYLKMLKKDYYKKIETVELQTVSEKLINRTTLILGVVFALIATYLTTVQLWFEILKFANSTSFGLDDPIFGNDVSFYVFKLGLINEISYIVAGLIFGFVVLTVVYYLFLMSVRRPRIFDEKQEPAYDDYSEDGPQQGGFGGFGSFGKNTGNPLNKSFNSGNFKEIFNLASRQIIILATLFFIVLAVTYFLRQYSLLYTNTELLYGAGFTAINVTLLMYRLLIGLALISAITVGIGIKKRSIKIGLAAPALMIVVGMLGSGAGMLVQNFIVAPDEISKESEYLGYNIEFTQAAYGLTDIAIKEFPAGDTLSSEDIQNNEDTIANIRINDYQPAKQFYNQTQSIRQYYSFNDVDVDRYMVNGKYTQTFLSAREINEANMQDQQKTWLNKHLKYTHGYGITLSRVDKVTSTGQPDMLIDGIPPISRVPEIQIDRPEIYFGELTNDYVIVNTDEEEFDYPSGENNIYNMYEGTAGIKLNVINRILFSIQERNFQTLVSTNIDSESRILVYRNIQERISKIFPFLMYDEDPYIVTVGGKLYWMVDGYTVSSDYPYSMPRVEANGVSYNYIRNSVKVVVDAYNGDTNFYIVDETEPVIATMAKIYPDLFKSLDEMPEGLQAHMRYPNKLFNTQADMYKRYHMSDVRVFYQGEDLWDISYEIYEQERVPMTPNYYIMKLPGEETAEFINSIPYTPRNKPNMSGLLVARNDGASYGELILYRMPNSKLVYGPMHIENQVNQNTIISQDFALWSSAGTNYSRGNIFVIPIEDSIIYVEPIYLQSNNENSLPEVKRVIVAFGDRIAYEETLDAAINKLFGAGSVTSTPGEVVDEGGSDDGTVGANDAARLANEAFENALAAQRNGDWASYGTYLDELERYLNMLVPTDDQDTTQVMDMDSMDIDMDMDLSSENEEDSL